MIVPRQMKKKRSLKKTTIMNDQYIRRQLTHDVMSLMLIGGMIKPKYNSDSAERRLK